MHVIIISRYRCTSVEIISVHGAHNIDMLALHLEIVPIVLARLYFPLSLLEVHLGSCHWIHALDPYLECTSYTQSFRWKYHCSYDSSFLSLRFTLVLANGSIHWTHDSFLSLRFTPVLAIGSIYSCMCCVN